MKLFVLCLVLGSLSFVHPFVLPEAEQFSLIPHPKPGNNEEAIAKLQTEPQTPQRIAVIGSGITGAITANRLFEGSRRRRPEGPPPSITVFERNAVVGGRITQAYAYDDYRFPVDTCADYFAITDICIASAVLDVGLVTLPLTKPQEGTGVWDGEFFVGFIEEDGFRGPQLWSPFQQRKWKQRYGNAPLNFSTQVTNVRINFDQLLASPVPAPDSNRTPGKSNLKKEVTTAGLKKYVQNFYCSDVNFTSLDGAQGELFAREVLNAAGRERFFADEPELNVLEFFLGFEDASPSAVVGGNLQLVDRLLRLSTADVRLSTEVTQINRLSTGVIELTSFPIDSGQPSVDTFDIVVIATSLDLANMAFNPPLRNTPGLEQKYRDSFVTHFTTASELNATYFNRTGAMPQNILTTLPLNDPEEADVPFFSLTLLTQLIVPDTDRVENLYKLVSREEVPVPDIERFLLADKSFNGSIISWVHRQPLPKSVPVVDFEKEECEEILGEIEIAPRIYYAGGGEQVVASAEFGCRMGLNVANLIVDGEE